MQCSILGYRPAGMCFSSGSRRHMSVTFHVWNAVISLSMVEPKSAMHNSDRGNRGVRNWEWSGVEQNRAEWSRIRIIRIKIKEKCDIIAICHLFTMSKYVRYSHRPPHRLVLSATPPSCTTHHPLWQKRSSNVLDIPNTATACPAHPFIFLTKFLLCYPLDHTLAACHAAPTMGTFCYKSSFLILKLVALGNKDLRGSFNAGSVWVTLVVLI